MTGWLWRLPHVLFTFLFVISCPPSSEWLINVLKIVAGELNMLEILVVLARRHVERRTATAATAFQATFVSTNVDQKLVARGICAFLVQRHMDCRVATSPDK
jgi:hypothetical protein